MQIAPAPPSTASGAGSAGTEPRIRRLAWHDLDAALRDGWADFLALPSQLGFVGLIYPIVGLIAARSMLNGDVLDLLYPVVAGLSLLGPVLATGVYELSRRRERGVPAHPMDAFKVINDPAMPSVALLGLLLLAIAVLWILAARAVFAVTLGVEPPGMMSLLHIVFGTTRGWELLVIGNLVGLLFAAVTLALTVISVPMVLDRNVSAMAGIRTSLRVVSANPAMVAAWGLVVAVLLVLGSIPLFVGLAVVMPLLGHATWHLYRRAVAW